MKFALGPTVADRRLLPEGWLAGPMPWVIAIMIFLTVLATAGGIGLGQAAHSLGADLEDRVTVQIVEANPDLREAQARAALRLLAADAGVREARRVDPGEVRALIEPWLGEGAQEADLPMPALIDVDLAPGGPERVGTIAAALSRAAPTARVDDHAQSLAPLSGLIGSLKWLAFALVALMAGATAATVVLAARAALNNHRPTIDVMHLLGATDTQIARLFQRRIALDALFGGMIGLVLAVAVLLLLGRRMAALGSELVGSLALAPWTWAVLLLVPAGGTLLAMFAARLTVLNALRKIL